MLAALRAMGRDNARTPMQWDASEHAGFTTGTPWLAVNPNHVEINAAAERADPDSVFHHYRRLIELRHAEPAVASATSRCCSRTTSACTRSRAGSATPSCSCSATSPASASSPRCRTRSAGDDAEVVAGAAGASALALEPWEGRALRTHVQD